MENKSPLLSIDTWLELGAFRGHSELHPDQYTFPMSTPNVLILLGNIGIFASPIGIERAIRLQEVVVPKKGRNRAWSRENVESLIQYITSGQATATEEEMATPMWEARPGSLIPGWLRFYSAEFLWNDIDANEWAKAHMAYIQEHAEPLSMPARDGRSVRKIYRMINPWFLAPEGAALLRYSDGDQTTFRFVPKGELSAYFNKPATKAGKK